MNHPISWMRLNLFTLCALLACNLSPELIASEPDLAEPPPDIKEQSEPIAALEAVAELPDGFLQPVAGSQIVNLWANEGGDKVTRNELRASIDPSAVLNSAWDGAEISLFGAGNETVSLNLVLEAPLVDATNISVELTTLNGPDGAAITTRSASGDDLFNFVGRNIELFYIRYLEIKGISTDLFFAGFEYDERHIPERCRRSYNEVGDGFGSWTDRPCHNQIYPDIAVPLELETPFTIPQGTNQSIWGDIYIPKDTPPGEYTGTITLNESGQVTWEVPIRLQVHDFILPDMPAARTMLYFSGESIIDRYLGSDFTYPDRGTATYQQALDLIDTHFQLAHRHGISMIGDINGYTSVEEMGDAWEARLSGELFTPERGYDGIGVGVGNGVYSIGTYESWPWSEGSREDMWTNTDAWVEWFDSQSFETPTDYFLYLLDETDDYQQLQEWATWIEDNPGPGSSLLSFATLDMPTAVSQTPSLDVPTSWMSVGLTDEWRPALDSLENNPDKRTYLYNSNRPATGSFATEDEGVALRVIPWTQYKFDIDRWFYWESTYYSNFQCYGEVEEAFFNVFQQAQTFGCADEISDSLGETGWNYLNGDGVLFYPGTDTRYPDESYGVMGPFASLRLKHWRRGIQDVAYLSLAAEIDPERTAEIVQSIIPSVLWEVGVTDPQDPSYVLSDISWSVDPDVWEAARAELVDVIESSQ
ncbi:MAG: DUF4091 domain-containing protein [Chloroflexi bacterium]|nr:MAG: DUF4091 domain-containing protein [Chloroflexota bacterium]MBL1196365.1 DUF4091 domain-containing protein [Chloroflexota bacterium]NOH13660.1 DUF4091 domain-containing protein [Chloroflexota bacterium]